MRAQREKNIDHFKTLDRSESPPLGGFRGERTHDRNLKTTNRKRSAVERNRAFLCARPAVYSGTYPGEDSHAGRL